MAWNNSQGIRVLSRTFSKFPRQCKKLCNPLQPMLSDKNWPMSYNIRESHSVVGEKHSHGERPLAIADRLAARTLSGLQILRPQIFRHAAKAICAGTIIMLPQPSRDAYVGFERLKDIKAPWPRK
jgi:hypothetical protein